MIDALVVDIESMLFDPGLIKSEGLINKILFIQLEDSQEDGLGQLTKSLTLSYSSLVSFW
jgi:hypothetical protein